MKTCFRIFFFLAIAILFSLSAPRSWAQGVTSSGTDYWLGFMPNGSGAGNTNVYEQLFIASGTDNTVTITIPGKGPRTITLTAGSVQDYDVTGQMTYNSEIPTSNAIHVTSTSPITVYGYSAWGNSQGIGDSPDGFLALPLVALGTEYYTVNFPTNGVFGQNPYMPGEFLVTSPYDDNVITINPAADTKGGHHQGVAWSVTLMKGQTYLVQSATSPDGENDLTGSLITSTKPISVLTGHQISSVPTEECCSADNLFEMIPSFDRWGTQYYDMPMAGKTVVGDYIRVLSAEDGNKITWTGATTGGPHGPMILNAGEYSDIPMQTDALVLKSINNKKFIVAQYSYSQGYDGDPGMSDPWMVLFTPQEQFEKEMIFRTPSSRRGYFVNYVTFISQWDSLEKIQINGLPITTFTSVGKAEFPGTNPRMGAYRVIIGPQAKNYIATLGVPFGAYQYGFSNYEGYGWPTGMAQRLITPDTLPPLMAKIDSDCGNYNLLFTEPRTKPTFSFNDSHIASVSMITEPGDLRWPTPSYNYTFTPDPNFLVGDSTMTATLTVNDHTKDAYAAIDAVDLAGNDTVYQYYYFAPKITFSPAAPYNFGTVLDGADSCQTITITNIQPAGEFNAESDSIGGFAKGGTFTVTPRKLSPIADSASTTIQVCFQPTDTGVLSIDSLYVNSECVSYAMPLMGTGVTPLIYAMDLPFGEVDSGKTKCLPLTIYNRGKAPLTITAQDLVSDPNFSVDPNQVFPITILPGQSTTISYCFHPQSWGNFSKVVTFLNLNPAEFQHSIKDTALLTGIALPAGAVLTSYTKKFTISCNDTTLYDTVYDNLPKEISVIGLELGGPDSAFFTITQQPPSFPFKLTGDSTPPLLPFQLLFNTTKNGLDLTPRTAWLKVITAEGGPQPKLVIQAQLVTPIVQISPNSIDLGTARIKQQTLPKTFTIRNAGNAPMNITSYNLTGANAGLFTFTPAPPFTIAGGDSQVVTITAIDSEDGNYSTTFSFADACDSTSGSVDGAATSVAAIPHGATYPTTYTGGCRSNVESAALHNTSQTDSITITSVEITGMNGWIDTLDFAMVAPPQGTIVPPGQTDSIPIVFVPTATGSREAALIFHLQGKNPPNGTDTTWETVVELQGSGAAVTRAVGIAGTTSPTQYNSVPGANVSVPVVVNTAIDQGAPNNGTNEAYGYSFDISWKRDAFQYVGVVQPGVVVDTPIYDPKTDMETRLVHFESATPLSGVTKLATLGLRTMLTKSDSTPIHLSNVEWLGKDTAALCYVSTDSLDGSHVLDPVCGSATLQNYMTLGSISVDGIKPDPAHSSAEIDYTVVSARPISASICDLLGNTVKQLMDMQQVTAGAHTLRFTSEGLPSGTYYCRMTDGHFVAIRQFEVVK